MGADSLHDLQGLPPQAQGELVRNRAPLHWSEPRRGREDPQRGGRGSREGAVAAFGTYPILPPDRADKGDGTQPRQAPLQCRRARRVHREPRCLQFRRLFCREVDHASGGQQAVFERAPPAPVAHPLRLSLPRYVGLPVGPAFPQVLRLLPATLAFLLPLYPSAQHDVYRGHRDHLASALERHQDAGHRTHSGQKSRASAEPAEVNGTSSTKTRTALLEGPRIARPVLGALARAHEPPDDTICSCGGDYYDLRVPSAHPASRCISPEQISKCPRRNASLLDRGDARTRAGG